MKKGFITFGILLLLICINLNAVSLWENNAMDMYSETKAHRLGDIVTIIINESAKATSQAASSTKGENNMTLTAGTGPLKFLPGATGKVANDFSGDASTVRTGNLQAKITATIVKIFSNGNFFVKGTRRVTVNSEIQEIEISGIARPEDILQDNSIQSAYLADAKVKYNGRGIVGDIQRPGLINKLFQFLF